MEKEPVVMRLDRRDFDRIKEGKQIWELRLNDLKRKNIRSGDTIVFMRRPELQERLEVTVLERQHFNDMQRLLDVIPMTELRGERMDELEFIQSFMVHYRPEEVVQHGIVAFKLLTLRNVIPA